MMGSVFLVCFFSSVCFCLSFVASFCLSLNLFLKIRRRFDGKKQKLFARSVYSDDIYKRNIQKFVYGWFFHGAKFARFMFVTI